MLKLTTCRIDALDVFALELRSGQLTAQVGFLSQGRPFGVVELGGLLHEPTVQQALAPLIEAIEKIAAAQIGTTAEGAPAVPRGLLDRGF